MDTLKPREQNIYDFMKRETTKKGYPPTVREICTALNIRSTSTVHKDIARLESKGYIRKDPSKPRAISFVDKAWGNTPGSAEFSRDDIVDVPLVGHIAAGTPILADENLEGFIPVPAEYIRGDNFMLTVRGDSMVEAGILDGDKILVREQRDAHNGEIVVALLQGIEAEATVKTYYREGDHVRLQPENEAYSPIIVRDVQILGVVKGVFRYLQ
ncbi:MAG: transcriptional repressor LexA [Clostridiales bacterium]|nr:transcriptional repressor LexA [Clostridiales bacterium]